MHELGGGEDEAPLDALLARMSPVDLILVEGWKRDSHPKVEAYRQAAGNPLIAPGDPTIRAVAADVALELDRPVLALDDTIGVADLIARELEL
jgi:molybdopterin-guanine dinucleotide biosynthesis protein MobB